MSDTEELEDVYAAQSAEDTRRIYNKWSHSYDADNLSRGYRLPALGAGLLAQYLRPDAGPVLDAGSGTGLVGETLRLMGFDHLIACDLSPEMLCVSVSARLGLAMRLHVA